MTRASPPAHFTSNASEEVEGEGGSSRGGSRVAKPGVALRSLAAGHFETARQGVWGARWPAQFVSVRVLVAVAVPQGQARQPPEASGSLHLRGDMWR